ncbi:hypothetical protein B0H13DRAFT_2658327, partial [Mycena leptocephala]
CSTNSCPPPPSPPCSWHKRPYPHPRSRPLVATNHAPPRPFVFFVLSLQSYADTHIAGLSQRGDLLHSPHFPRRSALLRNDLSVVEQDSGGSKYERWSSVFLFSHTK